MNPEIKKALVILLLYKNELKDLAKKSTSTTIDDTLVDMLLTGATMLVGADFAATIDKEFPTA
jgi:hypothetical protein